MFDAMSTTMDIKEQREICMGLLMFALLLFQMLDLSLPRNRMDRIRS